MMRSRRGIVGVLVASLFLVAGMPLAVSVRGQSPDTTSPIRLIPRTKAEREQRHEEEHRISLSLRATDSTGNPVAGLKAKDFVVLDNGKAQNIYRFRAVDGKAFTVRAHAIVVLDGVNGRESEFMHVKKGLDGFLGRSKQPLPIPLSLFFISSARTFETRPSTDRARITAELADLARLPRDNDCEQPKLRDYEGIGARMFPTPQEKIDCRFNHFSESIKALRTMIAERQNSRLRDQTILIWTGAGWPNAILSKGNYGDLLVELTTNIRRAQETLDAVSWNDFESFRGLKTATDKVPQTSDDLAAQAMMLQALSSKNGGQAIARTKDFAGAMSRCIEDASNLYMVVFDSASAATSDEPHSIEVKVDRPGVTVRAANSYYAQP